MSALEFAKAWVEATAAGDAMASAHLNIVNLGTEADELVAAFSPSFERALLHTRRAVPFVGQNPSVAVRIQVAPRSSLTVGSQGIKLLLIDPVQPLRSGSQLTLTLRFRNTGDITVELPVLAAEQRAKIAQD